MPSRFGIGVEIALVFAIMIAGWAIHTYMGQAATLAERADAFWGAAR